MQKSFHLSTTPTNRGRQPSSYGSTHSAAWCENPNDIGLSLIDCAYRKASVTRGVYRPAIGGGEVTTHPTRIGLRWGFYTVRGDDDQEKVSFRPRFVGIDGVTTEPTRMGFAYNDSATEYGIIPSEEVLQGIVYMFTTREKRDHSCCCFFVRASPTPVR